MVSTSIVIPCYRSAGTLPRLVARLTEVMKAQPGPYEIILVVDGSPDNTGDVAQDLARAYDAIRVIQLARNYGQHNAIIAGVRAARHDVIVTMDDDLQHPPEQVPVLLAALTDDVDLVYGVADKEEHGVARSFASRLIKAGMSGPLGVHNARLLSAFRAFRTALRGSFDQVRGPHVSVDMALSWATTKVCAAKVRMEHRNEGRSGYTLRSLFRHAINMIVGYSTLPLRMVTYLGLFVGLVGVILFARVLWLYLDGGTSVAGYTTTASMIALFSAAQMVGIGILGEYVGRIHTGGLGRPTYVVLKTYESLELSMPALTRPAADPIRRVPAPAGDLES